MSKHYPREYKLAVSQLVSLPGLTAESVARAVGISPSTVRAWHKKWLRDEGAESKQAINLSDETLSRLASFALENCQPPCTLEGHNIAAVQQQVIWHDRHLVYVIQHLENPELYKVGVTKRLPQRLRELAIEMKAGYGLVKYEEEQLNIKQLTDDNEEISEPQIIALAFCDDPYELETSVHNRLVDAGLSVTRELFGDLPTVLQTLYEPAFSDEFTTEIIKTIRLHPGFEGPLLPVAKEEAAAGLDQEESRVKLAATEVIAISDGGVDPPPKSWDHQIEDNGVLAVLVFLTLLILFILVVIDAAG